MPIILDVVEFTREQQGLVQGFDCGSAPWSRAISEWITGPDVLQSIQKYGTRVFLYFTIPNSLVGYGSIGRVSWSYPYPHGERQQFAIIPRLGIQVPFQHGPAGTASHERYSHQIMRHLLTEAQALGTEFVGVQLHRDNIGAKKLYDNFGFLVSDEINDQIRMLRRLR